MVQSVDRALELLNYLKVEDKGFGVTELANKMGIAKSTVHRLLASLEKQNYVKKLENQGTYVLGLKFIEMGQVVVGRLKIIETAKPLLQKLTNEVGEITHLGMLEGFELVYIDKVEANSTIRIYSQTGRRAPLHCTGIGKCLLAYFPEEKLNAFFKEAELNSFTPNTFTKEDELRKELKTIRGQGYAFDNEEHEEGIRCVAAPIFNHQGEVIYAISATGPVSRMSVEKANNSISLVKETAQKISERIGY